VRGGWRSLRNRQPFDPDAPPGRVFHAALLVSVLALLWARSVPGSALAEGLAAAAALGLVVLVWFGRGVTYLIARRRRRARRGAAGFLVAPAVGALALVLVALDTPLHARWALSRGAFEDVVEAGPASSPDAVGADRWQGIEAPDRIGLYRITSVSRVGEAVIFWEAHGAFIDDAGFAYLPDGPDPALEAGWFESPTFHHLGGPWYTWTASW
jgi:hypothetical protein